MSEFFKELLKRIPAMLILSGIFFIAISLICIDFSTFSKIIRTVEEMKYSNFILLTIGCILIICGLLWAIDETTGINNKPKNKLTKNPDGTYSINFGKEDERKINIIYGEINVHQRYDENTLVILSSDSRFSEQSIESANSVLAAFAQSLHPKDNEEFRNKIKENSEPGNRNRKKYIYLPGETYTDNKDEKNENKKFNVGIVAVTTIRDQTPEVAGPKNIIAAVNSIHEILVRNGYINKTYIPLIGSGRLGPSKELAFLLLLISILEISRMKGMKVFKEINIVIHSKDKDNLAISKKRMKAIVNFAFNYCE